MPGCLSQVFRFASDSRATTAAREAVRSAVGDLRREVLSDVLLCVTELVTNSVTHPEAEPSDPIELRIARYDDRVRLELSDRDRGVTVEQARRAPGDPAFGLYIIELLSDRWGVERGEARTVWLEKDFAEDDSAPPAPTRGRFRRDPADP